MDFKLPYLLAMRDQAPQMAVGEPAQQKAEEASRLFQELGANIGSGGDAVQPNKGLRAVTRKHKARHHGRIDG
jgi:hypothetical protein